MRVEPRFRDQIRCLVLKDRKAKALHEALSPGDRVAFNGFLVSVVAVLLAPRRSASSALNCTRADSGGSCSPSSSFGWYVREM